MKAYYKILVIGLMIVSQFLITSPRVNAQEIEVVAENLVIPWAIEIHEETFYITERGGSIVKVVDGQIERQKVHLEHELSDGTEAGLLGFVLKEDFNQSQAAYAYYSYQLDGEVNNRVIILELLEGEWYEVEILLDGIPSANIHDGGRLAIGPDGYLYISTGDAAEPQLSQDIQSLAGKILRLELDGEIPSDNPFENSYVYSYGHRNPQGLAWTADGSLYASEHGNQSQDEINLIEAGLNYGWPNIEGMTEEDGMEIPLFTSGPDLSWAPSGMGEDEGKLYVAALRGNAILVFDLESGELEEWATDYGRIRDIIIEDGVLYFITNNTDGRGDPREADDKLYTIDLEQ